MLWCPIRSRFDISVNLINDKFIQAKVGRGTASHSEKSTSKRSTGQEGNENVECEKLAVGASKIIGNRGRLGLRES